MLLLFKNGMHSHFDSPAPVQALGGLIHLCILPCVHPSPGEDRDFLGLTINSSHGWDGLLFFGNDHFTLCDTSSNYVHRQLMGKGDEGRFKTTFESIVKRDYIGCHNSEVGINLNVIHVCSW